MTGADYVVAAGLGLIVGALIAWNATVGFVVMGVVFIGLAALFGLTEKGNR